MATEFGRVPHPAFRDRPITKPEGCGQNDLGKRSVKGVVWHRMYGRLNGTYQHFSSPSVCALTDYGVGVAAVDGDALDGVIDRYNDPLGRQSGWASGTYSSAAYGDGLAFVEKYGINAINRDQASIEISGFYDTPLSDAARDAIVNLTAYWADQYEIPWDVWPIAPQDGFSFVRWHNEFGPDNGAKVCPGSVVMQETSALIERVRTVLRIHQTESTGGEVEQPTYVPPVLPDWWADSLESLRPTDQKHLGATAYVMRRNFKAVDNTVRRSEPMTSAKASGPSVKAGEKVYTERVWTDPVDGRQWLLENAGHWLLASKFSPAVRIQPRRS